MRRAVRRFPTLFAVLVGVLGGLLVAVAPVAVAQRFPSGPSGSGGANTLLTGASGGQTIVGGTATGETLLMRPTAAAGWGQSTGNYTQAGLYTNRFQIDNLDPDDDAATALNLNTGSGSATTGRFLAYGASYATSGINIAGSFLMLSQLSGGLSLAAVNASGDIRFYAGGSADTNLYGTLSDAGLWTFKRTAAEELGGIRIENNNLGGYGSSIRFYGKQNFGSNDQVENFRIQVTGEDTWGSAGATDSSVSFYSVINGTITERLRMPSNGAIRAVAAGSAATPTFSWTDDADTGIARETNTVIIAANGAEGLRVTDTLVTTNTDVTLRNGGGFELSVNAGVTASVTQSQGNGAQTKDLIEVSTVGTNLDVITIPAATAGRCVRVINNDAADTLQIFPASGDQFSGSAVDASVTLGAGLNAMYCAYNTTVWEAF